MGHYKRDAATGKRRRDNTSGRYISDACAGCCSAVYIRPRLCPSPDGALSGDTGADDEGHAIGLRLSSAEAAGSFFCRLGRCYYVPASPDYWDASAVPGTDFAVVTPGEWDSLPQFDVCDSCQVCARFLPGFGPPDWTFSPDSTITITVSINDPSLFINITAVDGADLVYGGSLAGTDCRPVVGAWSGTLTATYTDSHGAGHDHADTWTVVAGDLPGHWKIIAPTLPITGGTANVNGPFMVTDTGNTCGGGTADREGVLTGGGASYRYTISVVVNDNSCPCDVTLKQYRKWRAVWDCLRGSWNADPVTGKPVSLVYGDCFTGHVVYDWPAAADVQCTIVGGRKVKVFTMVEEVGDCPDALPAYPGDFVDADYPDPPSPDPDCTGCRAGSGCLWRYFALYNPTDHFTYTDAPPPVKIGCRRTKDFPTWRRQSGSAPSCLFAIDVFGDDCNDASDCGDTPPAAPALPVGLSGVSGCEAVGTCHKRITYHSEWNCEFATWDGEEGDQVPSYTIDSCVCVDGGTAAQDWEITSFDPGNGDPIATIEVDIGTCDCADVGNPCTPTLDEINDNRPGDPPFSGAGSCP